jgi:hypothetical protein
MKRFPLLFSMTRGSRSFQPIVVFNGEGRFITAVLRPAKRPSGKETALKARGLKRGMGSLCIGGGQAAAMAIEI